MSNDEKTNPEEELIQDFTPGPIRIKRLEPMEIIANQIISMNTHLASIASDMKYLREEIEEERKDEG